MRIFVIPFILLIYCNSNSQVYNKTNIYDNLKEYYGVINSAELALVNHDNSKSLKLYNKAFKIRKEGFSSDYYNAALVSALNENYKETFHFLNELSKLGLDPRTFKNIDIFKKFWLSKYGIKAELLDSLTPKIYNVEYRSAVYNLLKEISIFVRKTMHT
jgi:hypothetical protein